MSATYDSKAELAVFREMWPGGFYAGNPGNPMYGQWGITAMMGIPHAIYLACIKPNVTSSTTVLEIGCGRGAWSKLMLNAKHLYCLDALGAEHNGFYEYVGRHPNVEYFQVADFSLREIPLDSIDFAFSYDALCHASIGGITEYATSLHPRMKAGAQGFWMVADYNKYNAFVRDQDRYSALQILLPRGRLPMLRRVLNPLFRRITRWNAKRHHLRLRDLNEDSTPIPGRWYHAGTERTCAMLEAVGFTVIDPDIGFDYRSPVIHFRK
jgi:SAM-dependent methyltransferase